MIPASQCKFARRQSFSLFSGCSPRQASANSSENNALLGTNQPGIEGAIPICQTKTRIKKPLLHLFPKLRRRLRPGLPPTLVQRQAGIPTQMTIANRPAVASRASDYALPLMSTATVASTAYKKDGRQELPSPMRNECECKGNALILQGDYWQVTFTGATSILEDTRGLRYIAFLIREAGHGPIYASELVAFATGNHSAAVELENKEALMDSAAENQLVKRLEDIGFERNSAAAQDNYERVAALDEEIDRITEELQRARTPHKGHGRRATFNNSAEKARKAVSKAISETISRMTTYPDLEPLARHLSMNIQKGQWLSYNGSEQWHIDFQIPVAEKSRLKSGSVATRKVAAAKAGRSK